MLVFPSVLDVTLPQTVPIVMDYDEVMATLAFSHDGRILAVCSRTRVYLYPMSDVARHAAERTPLPVQQLPDSFFRITGLSFSASRLFVADAFGIFEYNVLGVGSLKDLCVRRVLRCMQDNPNYVNFDALPCDVADALRPSERDEVEFAGVQVKAAPRNIEPVMRNMRPGDLARSVWPVYGSVHGNGAGGGRGRRAAS